MDYRRNEEKAMLEQFQEWVDFYDLILHNTWHMAHGIEIFSDEIYLPSSLPLGSRTKCLPLYQVLLSLTWLGSFSSLVSTKVTFLPFLALPSASHRSQAEIVAARPLHIWQGRHKMSL